jgi:hypothetical protein
MTLQEARELKALTDSIIENMNVISGDSPARRGTARAADDDGRRDRTGTGKG